jgi:hypothetical protein
MRRFLFAAFLALLFHGQYSGATDGGCFYVGGPLLDRYGCSIVVSFASGVEIEAGISGVFGFQFEASGQVTGNFGTVTSGSTSSPCQWFDSGAPGAPIRFAANLAPGVHPLTVTFTGCGVESMDGPYMGKVILLVLPPNPATNPPPTCGAVLIDPVKSSLLQGPAITINEGSILNPNPLMPPVSVQGVSADGVTQAIVAGVPHFSRPLREVGLFGLKLTKVGISKAMFIRHRSRAVITFSVSSCPGA